MAESVVFNWSTWETLVVRMAAWYGYAGLLCSHSIQIQKALSTWKGWS